MPTNLVKTKSDEKDWSRAKKSAVKQGLSGDRKWRLTNYIYQKIKGK